MDTLLLTAAAGMRSKMESLDLLANNISNMGTAGFKMDREWFGLFTSAEAAGAVLEDGRPAPVNLPVVERQWTDLSQGVLVETGNPLDLAISGKGFFIVQAATGLLYTRNGNFHLSKRGRIETAEGYRLRVLRPDGSEVAFDPAKAIEIKPEGIARQDGEDLGRVALADFEPGAAMVKQGSSYIKLSDSRLVVAPPKEFEIRQGKLENSNVPVAEGAVRLVSVLRQFEMLQRALSVGSEMNKRIDEIARTGS